MKQMSGDSYIQKGRVMHEDRSLLTVRLENKEIIRATIAGSFLYKNECRSQRPTVGDFVELTYNPLEGMGRITKLLERKTQLARKIAGEFAGEQILGANIDTAFYLSSLNMDLNLRRMERYLIMIKDGGINPVVLLTKADLVSQEHIKQVLDAVKRVVKEVPVIVTTTVDHLSFIPLKDYLVSGETIAFLGSSGVGKSSLTNIVMGDETQEVQVIRNDDDKGKHTTTARSLFELPNGCLIMDTPGIREVQLWEGDIGLNHTFEDVIELISNCRFSNCHHQGEPGCAVEEALDSGELDLGRLKSYIKLEREQEYMTRKGNAKELSDQKKIWKSRSKAFRRGRKKEWSV
jgi:ribosome biogenesis GTPase / thiamine phosphate phosphatase